MKKFKPFDKVLVRVDEGFRWYPDFYNHSEKKLHYLMRSSPKEDKNIIPYEGNEHLIGTTDEPEEEITLAVGELILMSDSIVGIREGLGVVLNYKGIYRENIVATNERGYLHCIPMSKYNPNNLEETRKWILVVQNGKLVKVNK